MNEAYFFANPVLAITRVSELFVIFIVSPFVGIVSCGVFYWLMNHIFATPNCGWRIRLLAALVLVIGIPFLALFLLGLWGLMLSRVFRH